MFGFKIRPLFCTGNLHNADCRGGRVDPLFFRALLKILIFFSAKKYEGNSISKLQIVIEKNRMEIMTYKQHLFFNIISIQI